MRLALIIAREHGEPTFAVISGPDTPYAEQVDRWKGLILTSESHEYAEIQLWTSDEGTTRRKRFRERLTEDGPKADLAAELASLDEGQLRELAQHNDIDLSGLTEKGDIITAIVIAVKLEHLLLKAPPEEEAVKQPPPPVDASLGDPGVFPAGPPMLALPPPVTT